LDPPVDGVDRILLCSAWAPWGQKRGYQMRLAMVAEALGQIAPLDVCVLDTMQLDELESDWPHYVRDAEWCQVVVEPRWAWRAMTGAASPVREAALTPAAERAARARFLTPPPALTWCVEARGYEPVADLVRHPVVLDLHNVHSAMVASKRKLLARRPWDRDLRALGGGIAYVPGLERRWAAWEKAAAARCDRVVVCSDLDRERLGTANAATIPNCYPRPRHPAGRAPRPDPAPPLRIGFVGVLDYEPNREGVAWFIQRILPLVRAAEPGAELVVVGRAAERLAEVAREPGVRCVGFVPDVADALREVDVLVIPLRVGGGTRFKVLEAFAHEIPAVSTTLGAEGIEARDGQHLLLRDDPAGFADAIVRAHRDPSLRRLLVDEGRRLYEERYTWERGVGAVRTLATELLAAACRHRPDC
jgi:glycosyltransferase involved in cell wall biosynthesis